MKLKCRTIRGEFATRDGVTETDENGVVELEDETALELVKDIPNEFSVCVEEENKGSETPEGEEGKGKPERKPKN